MQWLGRYDHRIPIDEGICGHPQKEGGLFRGTFLRLEEQKSSEKGSESERGYYEFQESAEHQSIFSQENNVHFHLIKAGKLH